MCADDVLVHTHICEPNKTFSSGYKVHKTQLNIELQTSETTVKNSLMDQHSVKCLVFICQKTSLDWQKLNMLPYSIRLKIKEGGVPQLEPHCVNMNFASVGSRFAPAAPSGNHPEGFSLIKSFPDLFGKVEDLGLNINHYNFIKKRQVSVTKVTSDPTSSHPVIAVGVNFA